MCHPFDRVGLHPRRYDNRGGDGNLVVPGVLSEIVEKIKHPGFIESRTDEYDVNATL